MFKIVVFFGIAVAACYARVTPTPAPATQPPETYNTPAPQLHVPAPSNHSVTCGRTPVNMLNCMKNQMTFTFELPPKVVLQCTYSSTECARSTCFFSNIGFLNSFQDGIDKERVTEYLNDLALEYTEWASTISHVKEKCLEQPVPAQGADLNCPAFDFVHCVFVVSIWNVAPADWLYTKECEYARQYAKSCPVCPGSCFAPTVPEGSCNACLSLPSSA